MAKRKLKSKKKSKRKSKKKENFFQLTWKKMYILVVGGFISILLHNLWYAIFGWEEAVFFIIVVILIPLYFIIAAIYSLAKLLQKKL